MEVAAEAGVIGSSKGPLADLLPLLIEAFDLVAQCPVDLRSTGFAVLFKILFCKTARSILAGTSAPANGHLWRIPGLVRAAAPWFSNCHCSRRTESFRLCTHPAETAKTEIVYSGAAHQCFE